MKKFLSLIVIVLIILPLVSYGQTANELEQQIKQRQQQIEELSKKAKIYEENVKIKRSQALTLKNQLAILDDQIEQTRTNIAELKLQIAQLGDEIKKTEMTISGLGQSIQERQKQLGELVRVLAKLEQQSWLETFVSSKRWYDALADRVQLGDVAEQVRKVSDELRTSRDAHNRLQQTLTTQKTDATLAKRQLDYKQQQLEDQQNTKQSILQQTKAQEKQFQTLLAQVKQEQEAAEADIRSLEAKVREKLKQTGVNFETIGPGGLSWSVPSRRITTKFYDPDYPFKRLFEHTGIDIGSTPQGTPIRATAAGYVGRAKDAGLGYSYIMLVHGGGLSTVYAHVSKILVAEGTYVARGQVIGRSGGMPGTAGAGRFTTGPHLHFEVRSNGVPVNPLNYLP
ncbi:MAG: peptidoglycan DD-metalloendopeptidase family protein [bacterium]